MAARTKEDLRRAKADWAKARRAEVEYGSQLRKIARIVATILRGFSPDDPDYAGHVSAALRRYADMIDPWAESVAKQMIYEVAARSDKEWRKVAAEMGIAIRAQFGSPDEIGLRFRGLLDEQVSLIKSIPLDAAVRVQEQVKEGVIEGRRFAYVAKVIVAEQPGISWRKATLIARTETGRATTALTQARAESVGSKGYQWRTARDADVRPSHKAMEGEFVAWDSPPTLDGLTGHAGALPNCRCYCEPRL